MKLLLSNKSAYKGTVAVVKVELIKKQNKAMECNLFKPANYTNSTFGAITFVMLSGSLIKMQAFVLKLFLS